MSLLIKLLLLSGLILILLGWIHRQNLVSVNYESDSTSIATFNNTAPHKAMDKLDHNVFSHIDLKTRSLPPSAATSIDGLASEIKRYTRTDLEKARALYIWITENIRYDDQAYNRQQYPQYTPEHVLKHRTAVCEGYSALFEALGRKLGLDIIKISGHAKGLGYEEEANTKTSNHAWNVVNIDGRWRIIDATWGSGYAENINGRLRSQKKISNYWFDINPFEAIFSHFPEVDSFQFISPRIKKHEYQQLPIINEYFFKLGFDARELLEFLVSNPSAPLVDCYSFDAPIRVLSAPYYQILGINKPVKFHFHTTQIARMAIIDPKDQWNIYQPEKDDSFLINYMPTKRGKLTILYNSSADSLMYQSLLVYTVK